MGREYVGAENEEILDTKPRRRVGETPDKTESARGLSNRFCPIRRALADCQEPGICGVRRNGRSAFGPREWIAAELNGYPDLESPPSYRSADGTLQVQNPYRGWMIVTGEPSPPPMTFPYSISQIEEFSKQETVYISPRINIPLSPPAYESLPQRVVFSGIVFKGMIETVRDRLLDWSLELEKRGITGENM
jgi:hypothetical protein